MMADMPLASIVERINLTLESVVAPEIASPIVRGQLFAVVELLNQLPGRFDYRHDFLAEDIVRCREILAYLAEPLAAAGVAAPEEASAAARPVGLGGMSGDQLREERDRVQTAVSNALDLLHAHRENVGEVRGLQEGVLDRLMPGVLRDVGQFRRQRFDRISQREEKAP